MEHYSGSEYPRTYALRRGEEHWVHNAYASSVRKPLSDGTHERQPLFQQPTLWRCFSKLQPYIQ